MKFLFSFFSVLVVLLYACTNTGIKNPDITGDELLSHIRYLSSDSLQGRYTGTTGDSLAAEYIRKELISYGLSPLSGDGFQRFKITDKVITGPGNSLSVYGRNFIPEKDFAPYAFSENSALKSEIVFAGYGFNIKGDSLKWNDYNGIDVKGKWAMILRGDPESDNMMSVFVPFSGDRDKALLAKDMGAAGVILVSGPAFDKEDDFESLAKGENSVGIPVFRIKRPVADFILAKSGNKIEDLEKKLNRTRKPASFITMTTADGKSEIIQEKSSTRNVVMILPGEDSQLKNEFLIIGAHFDHLGKGGPGSSSRAVDTVAVHHGADDNASGVSMLLELAEKFSGTKKSHNRSLIFIAFSGEEEGLLGSKYFTANPGIDLSKVNAMINIDMVGRLQETNTLQVGGVGTADELKNLVLTRSDTSVIKLVLSDEGYGPSDHSSFYLKNIPVLFYSTGAHSDYHTPSDTYDKINYKGMEKISYLIFNVSKELACSVEKLHYRESGPKVETGRALRRKGVTLGIMPDFAGVIKNGLRADFVTPGKPAALGGMKKGDIITSINGKSVNNIQDYMFRLNQLKHGQTISVEVLRYDKKVILIIQL
jgi:aminopeptidase YwaD